VWLVDDQLLLLLLLVPKLPLQPPMDLKQGTTTYLSVPYREPTLLPVSSLARPAGGVGAPMLANPRPFMDAQANACRHSRAFAATCRALTAPHLATTQRRNPGPEPPNPSLMQTHSPWALMLQRLEREGFSIANTSPQRVRRKS